MLHARLTFCPRDDKFALENDAEGTARTVTRPALELRPGLRQYALATLSPGRFCARPRADDRAQHPYQQDTACGEQRHALVETATAMHGITLHHLYDGRLILRHGRFQESSLQELNSHQALAGTTSRSRRAPPTLASRFRRASCPSFTSMRAPEVLESVRHTEGTERSIGDPHIPSRLRSTHGRTNRRDAIEIQAILPISETFQGDTQKL